MANAELLHETLEHIKANPEQWDQKRFSTCFAGWTVRLDNPALIMHLNDCSCGCFSLVGVGEGESLSPWDIQDRATKLLNLNTYQANELFAMYNTLDDLERIVLELTAEALLSA